MPIADKVKRAALAARAREALQTKRFLWLHREIWIHGPTPEDQPAVCVCCNSEHARIEEKRQHLDVLIDRQTGERWVRSKLKNKAAFDELAKRAKRIDCPIRCSRKQLRVILDTKHRIIGVFGGERAGKSTAESEWFFDRILERGGRGALFWWVSNTRKMALQIGLKKLVKGEQTDRWNRPIIPEELVVSYPRGVQHDVPLLLIDGTEVHFHHASLPDADNLKGQPPVAVVMDEGCTVEHETNWTQLKLRISDANGQLLTATTPKIGHYLQRDVRERGKSYDEVAELEPVEAAKVEVVYTTLSQRENPWMNRVSIERSVEALGNDELKIRAHIDGEWVAIGRQLWRHFDERVHLIEGPWRDVKGWGLINITKTASMRFFHRTQSDLRMIGGQDFNVDPHNVVVAQIAVPQGMDQSNRANWIVFILDHLQSVGTITEFAKWMAEVAAPIRKLPQGYFANMAIACDPTGAHANPHKVHGLRGASTFAREMLRRGFDCRSCHLSEKGFAQSPPRLDSISLVHKLMSDRVKAPDGREWPRLIVHGTRCPELVHSFKTQLADERGDIDKKSHTVSDVISGPTDALRYLVWAVPGQGPEYQTRRARTSFTH